MLKVCAVTGSRSDWGLLAPVLALLRNDPVFELKLVVTGQHLIPGTGETASVIESEGFCIAARVDMVLAGDTAVSTTKSLGLAVIGFADVLDHLRPDLLLVLGDRYEIFGAVQAALLACVSVAHLCGGDVTEGAVDEAIRHAITKMSHLHFVTNCDAERRIRQLGEDPTNIHCVGSPGLDRIRQTPVMKGKEFFDSIGLKPHPRNLLVTFHPETLEVDTEKHCIEMLAALDSLGSDVGLIFTGSNADTAGRAIYALIHSFVRQHANAVVHHSLGSTLYFSALHYVDMVVGNSSSGLYEAPSFGIPTVNIGDRQRGRLRAASVIDCEPERTNIGQAIQRGFGLDFTGVENPYGDGHAAERICAVLKTLNHPGQLLKKHFFDWRQS